MLSISKISTYIKLSKAQISKNIQSGFFLGAFLGILAGPITKTALPLVKNILLPLGLTSAAFAADPGIHKRFMDRD